MLKSIYIEYYIVSFIMIIMFILLFIIGVYIFRSYRIAKKIEKMTYLLSKDIDSSKIEEYILYIDSIEIYPREYTWTLIKAAYILVQENEDIKSDLKIRLRKTILSKGIII